YRQRFPAHGDLVASVFRAAGGWVGPPSGEADSSHPSASTGAEPIGGEEAERPARLGRYRGTARLGAGGLRGGDRGYDDELRRDVAIKVPHRHRVAELGDAESYLAEARVLASLDHSHIVPVHDVGRTDNGLCYVVSKFIEGCDLKAKLQEAPPSVAES